MEMKIIDNKKEINELEEEQKGLMIVDYELYKKKKNRNDLFIFLVMIGLYILGYIFGYLDFH